MHVFLLLVESIGVMKYMNEISLTEKEMVFPLFHVHNNSTGEL